MNDGHRKMSPITALSRFAAFRPGLRRTEQVSSWGSVAVATEQERACSSVCLSPAVAGCRSYLSGVTVTCAAERTPRFSLSVSSDGISSVNSAAPANIRVGLHGDRCHANIGWVEGEARRGSDKTIRPVTGAC
jgi:hypothetical protein